jgi:hypothetical protein
MLAEFTVKEADTDRKRAGISRVLVASQLIQRSP